MLYPMSYAALAHGSNWDHKMPITVGVSENINVGYNHRELNLMHFITLNIYREQCSTNFSFIILVKLSVSHFKYLIYVHRYNQFTLNFTLSNRHIMSSTDIISLSLPLRNVPLNNIFS